MLNRWAAVALLTTILGSALVLLPSPVLANPGCGVLGVLPAGVTTLTANVGPCPGYGLTFGPHTTELNCAGFTIIGTPGNTKAGIYLNGVTGATVENCSVTSFRYGIKVYSSNNNLFEGNVASGNKLYGIDIHASNNNNLTDNTANSNAEGFRFEVGSSGNYVGFNTANSNTKIGFSIGGSGTGTFDNNTADTNGAVNVHGVGFYIDGSHNVFNNNTANGNIGPGGARGDGFDLEGAGLNTFNNNTADSNTRAGFYILASLGNILSENVAGLNGFYGYADFTHWAAHAGPLNLHWDTRNFYGTVFDTDGGNANGVSLATGNANLATATDANL